MTLLWLLLAALLLLLVAIGMTLGVAVKWGRESVELRQYGVETTGRVVEKRRTQTRGALSTWIRYEYTDQFGRTHRSRRTLVTPDAWESHVDGGPIEVVYSQRRPDVSLPKYLVKLADRRLASHNERRVP